MCQALIEPVALVQFIQPAVGGAVGIAVEEGFVVLSVQGAAQGLLQGLAALAQQASVRYSGRSRCCQALSQWKVSKPQASNCPDCSGRSTQ
ncbi:hypothetical protein P308_17350 [Pseudomonas piscis]|nr:hypothetical protein P308_17350 [Pseudomonas piscis]